MNRFVIVVVTTTIAVAAALTAKVMLLPLGLVVLGAWMAWGRQPHTAARGAAARRWPIWLAAGALAIAAAVAIPAIDGGELNGFWWMVMAMSLLAGIAMTVAAVMLAISGHSQLAPTSKP